MGINYSDDGNCMSIAIKIVGVAIIKGTIIIITIIEYIIVIITIIIAITFVIKCVIAVAVVKIDDSNSLGFEEFFEVDFIFIIVYFDYFLAYHSKYFQHHYLYYCSSA